MSDTTEGRRGPWRAVRVALIVVIAGLSIALVYSATSMFWAVEGVKQDVDAASSAIEAGKFEDAASAVTDLASSATELADVSGSPTWSLAARLPVVGPTVAGLNVTAQAVSDVAVAAEPLVSAIAAAGSTTERVAALGGAEADLRNLGSTAESAYESVSQLDPSALRFGLGERVTELTDALPEVADIAYAGADAAAVLPGLVGVDGRRTWMVLLQNPAEARGSGGLFSAYTLVEMVDGRPTILEAETRKKTLDATTLPYQDVVSADSAALWGDYLGEWASFNVSGDFPEVARLAAAGMAANGTPIDGVVALDPSVVQALLSGTGKVEHRGVTIDGTNAAGFFTRDLYAQYPDFGTVEEKDELAVGLVYATIDSLLKRPLDYPTLFDTIPPVVEGGHLKVWSPDPTEEGWLDSIGVAGAVESLDPRTMVVALNNAVGGKLDAYVTPSVTVHRGLCRVPESGSGPYQRSAVSVTLTNDAPSGLPPYVDVRLDDPTAPSGSTRSLVHVYGPVASVIDDVARDGEYGDLVAGAEAGRPVWGSETELLQGQSSTLIYLFSEPVAASPDPVVSVPGTAIPAEVSVVEVGGTDACPKKIPDAEGFAALLEGS